MREKWIREVENYIVKRGNLACLFVLLDSRHKPQKSDLAFMEFLGNNQVPFARVFTKSDKLTTGALIKSIHLYDSEMMKIWDPLPPAFIASTVKKAGREEILALIEETLNNLSNQV